MHNYEADLLEEVLSQGERTMGPRLTFGNGEGQWLPHRVHVDLGGERRR